MRNKRRGLLLVVSGPSGAGKGTLCKTLVENSEDVFLSVSATTRAPRKDEIEGVSYFFKTNEQFEEMIKNGELLEWAKFCDNYYGTPRAPVEAMLSEGKDVILEIDVQGALQVKKKYKEGVYIFILPPSLEELKNRITSRGTETEDVIQERLKRARFEINQIHEYDYIVINDYIDKAVEDLRSIIYAEKCRVERNATILKEVCNI